MTDTQTAVRVLVVTGAGGVGKSTVSAAIAARRARNDGERVLLITVDPARRLAASMGVIAEGNDIVEVGGGAAPFWVSMLDTQRGWDALVERVAPDERTARRILSNGLYRNITSRFVNSHDYIAIERLWEVVRSGRFDTVVVDTPPSRNALSVIDAAPRMREFFASRLLRWLTLPSSNRVVALTSRPFFFVADRVLGARFLSDVAEFFALFRLMEPSFTAHASEVESMLRADTTDFVVVTTAEPVPVAEADHLVTELRARNLRLSAVVFNRLIDEETKSEARSVVGSVTDRTLSVAIDGILATVAAEDRIVNDVASRHGCPVVRIGETDSPVNDVAGVRNLGEALGTALVT